MNTTQAEIGVRIPQRFLVAVDADAISDNAIDAGIELARRFGAQIELLHVFRNSMFGTEYVAEAQQVAAGSDLATEVTRFVQDHVRRVLTAAQSSLRAEDVLHVLPGLPARVLLDRARATQADLLVLGSLRRRPVVDFGSTARAILAKASCPVLVQPGPRTTIRSILVPVDLSTESFLALATACTWARVLRARVHALHGFDTSVAKGGRALGGIAVAGAVDVLVERARREFEAAMAAFDWGGVDHATTFFEGEPVGRILDEAKSADMIAMGTHGRTGFAALLLGSVAYAVLQRATKPVLVVRDAERTFLA